MKKNKKTNKIKKVIKGHRPTMEESDFLPVWDSCHAQSQKPPATPNTWSASFRQNSSSIVSEQFSLASLLGAPESPQEEPGSDKHPPESKQDAITWLLKNRFRWN